MRARRRPGENGFTLVEVLVALIMAAILTSILLSGASLARRRTAAAQTRREALFVASNMLTESVAAPFSQEPKSGSVNGLAWNVSTYVLSSDPRGSFALIEYEARVADASGHQLASLQTRKVKVLPRS